MVAPHWSQQADNCKDNNNNNNTKQHQQRNIFSRRSEKGMGGSKTEGSSATTLYSAPISDNDHFVQRKAGRWELFWTYFLLGCAMMMLSLVIYQLRTIFWCKD